MARNIQNILETSDEVRRLVNFDDCSCLVIVAPGKPFRTEKAVVMLGGRGSTATETNITSYEASPFRHELLRRGFTILCPVCGSDHWGGPASSRIALRVLEQLPSIGLPVAKPLPVMGFSMGSLGAMMFAVRHPEWVQRLIGVFGGYDLPDIRRRIEPYRPGIDAVYPTPERLAESTPYAHIGQLRRIPVRLFHGTADKLVPCEYSQRLCGMLKAAGGEVDLTLVPGVGHSNELLALAKDNLLAALSNDVCSAGFACTIG